MPPTNRRRRNLLTIGWRERISLPDFDVVGISAKIDTGAQTSALHAFRPRYSQQDDGEWISFEVHPRRQNRENSVRVSAKVVTYRGVRSSNGKREIRPVISTRIRLGDETFNAEITLTNRNIMTYRMILGREALRGRFIVDSSRSYLVTSAESPTGQ